MGWKSTSNFFYSRNPGGKFASNVSKFEKSKLQGFETFPKKGKKIGALLKFRTFLNPEIEPRKSGNRIFKSRSTKNIWVGRIFHSLSESKGSKNQLALFELSTHFWGGKID